MQWHSAAVTHPGKCRSRNEDSVLDQAQQALWAVADGMGGHNAGDYASHQITSHLAQLSLLGDLGERVDEVEDTLLQVNDHLRAYAQSECGGQTVGSTVVTLMVHDSTGVVLWAGDSRLYRLRERELVLVTRDHNPVADLLDVGGVTPEEALGADTNVITRAIGGQPGLQLDVVVFDLQPGDTLLLCSDGLYREVHSGDLADALRQETPEQAVEDLLQLALASTARDNISMVVAKAGGES